MAEEFDAIVVGSGPNGLSAAVVLAQAGLSVLVIEAHDQPGGGARSAELTLPGFVHDVCSSVHPLGIGSPLFRTLALERHGLSWVHSPAALVHVLDRERAVTLERSLNETAEALAADGAAYRALLEPFVDRFDRLAAMLLGPLRLPRAPALYARFGLNALRSMQGLAKQRFRGAAAPALLAGIAAHAMIRLDAPATASFALVLAVAGHAVGWPLARGGSQSITNALIARLRELGGQIQTGHLVTRLKELPPARAILLDVTARQVASIAKDELPAGYLHRLRRFRYGPGVFKLDWALSGPIPWTNPDCARAATVHLSGDLDTVANAEAAVHAGALGDPPFVLLVQPTLADPTRAPAGKHIAWAYCHVPRASELDASDAIERLIERHAPGFRDLVLARATLNARQIQAYNPNYIGGDINGGLSDLSQLFFRPVLRANPYATPAPHIFVCSSSTPPGGGVHGMCGYWAAKSALARVFGYRTVERPDAGSSELSASSA